MGRIDALYQSLNVGVFDRDALHRVDLDRIRLAAERQTNLIPDAVGRATFRPGTEFISQASTSFLPISFIAGNNDAFVLMLSNMAMSVVDGSTDDIVTRASVSTTVTNGDFASAVGWTLAATSGQTSAISGGQLSLSARAHGGKATCLRSVTVAGGDVNVEHGLRIIVARGPVVFRCGSTSGGDEYISETVLRTGQHSLALTPTGTFYVYFESELPTAVLVDSIQVEAAGVMSLPTPWITADLELVRGAQSLDVMFCAADGYKRQRIERRSDTSWSVCDYDSDDGPFLVGRSANVKLTPSATEGSVTLTASAPFFQSTHVGALFRLDHTGQKVDTYLTGLGSFTDAFQVTGITETNFEERVHTMTVAGTWVGTLRNYRSFDGEFGDYHEYRRAQTVATIDITANATYTNDDNDDNAEVWVKMGFAAFTSGEAHITYTYLNGGGFGIGRVTAFTDSTHVTVDVLRPFKGTVATENWREGRWSGVQGQPAAVAISDGRLDWLGPDRFDASVSDAYESFDEEFEGDAGPISRSIALGGRNDVKWALPLSSLVIGCDARIANARASALDEIITPTNMGIKSLGKIGAAPISPLELADDRGLFVHASRTALYEIPWDGNRGRYTVAPFSKLTKTLFANGILAGMDVQSLPDQRVWVPINGDDAVMIVFEPGEQVLAAHVSISTSTTTDFFLGFCVLPGDDQDRVYAAVKRVVNGSTVYYLEKFALDSEAKVADITKVVDAHVTFGAGSAVITGLSHLEGRTVVAWADGAPVAQLGTTDAQEFVVSGGQITLPIAPTIGGCVGLPYIWQYKSARLAYGVPGYTPMLKNKSLAALGLLLADYCRSGITFGTVRGAGFDTPYSLSLNARGTTATEVVEGPGDDETPFPTGSVLDLDVRACIAGASPKPVTILAMVMGVETVR
jgi:hypothetical protein